MPLWDRGYLNYFPFSLTDLDHPYEEQEHLNLFCPVVSSVCTADEGAGAPHLGVGRSLLITEQASVPWRLATFMPLHNSLFST